MDGNIEIVDLTLEQKVAQLFMVSFDHPVLTEEDRAHFLAHGFSNFIYFAKNVRTYKETASLSKCLQEVAKKACGIPAFISVDQEGGMVARIFSGATHFPSNMAISAASMEDKMETIGRMVGEELRRLGVNMNLAPCLDVNNNPNNPVIGVRSYSDNPHVVARMGADYINGLQQSKVVATAKHFPGHGDTNVDSHLGLPKVAHSIERLNEMELIPFREAIARGVDGIMSAHIVFPEMEQGCVPATLSYEILTKFLRKQLGFDGLILTDSMSMDAIAAYYTTERGCVLSVLAGADLLCVCGDYQVQHQAYTAVLKAVESGEIPVERIDEAVGRILRIKKKYEIDFMDDSIEGPEIYKEHEELADEISRRSITLVRDTEHLIPLAGQKIFTVSTPPVTANIADDSLVYQEAFAKRLGGMADCPYQVISVEPEDDEVSEILKQAATCEVIVFATYNAILNKRQLNLANALCDSNKKVVIVALRIPYDIASIPKADACIAAYEYTNHSVAHTIDVLLGKLVPEGKIPVKGVV